MPKENIAAQAFEETQNFANAKKLVDIEGLSSPKVCNLLNQLVSRMDSGEHYLEIGCFNGLTLLSAAHNNTDKICIGCDKIRMWSSSTGFGFLVKRQIYRNIKRYQHSSAKVVFHHMKSEDLFRKGMVPAPVGVYFYDGDHSYQATKHHLVVARPLLSKHAVVVIDDWNDPEIRRATRDGFKEASLKVLWEKELSGENLDTSRWWNGLAVMYVEGGLAAKN